MAPPTDRPAEGDTVLHHLMNRFAVFVIGLSTDDPDRRGEHRGDRPDRGDVPG
ncbi:hypothetical protein [Brevibacterium aurantiacum]|uniref:hypothetical protein n=1 Tax=Brevibacterium aurantiacum TaxID=273384 RepID=UPI0013FD99DA|nr:hypothetical protein [Brevibacterium aurantiacum]